VADELIQSQVELTLHQGKLVPTAAVALVVSGKHHELEEQRGLK
jgi:hypothetical protein